MKKATLLSFLLAVAIGASAQSAITVPPNAHGSGVGPVAQRGPRATNATVPPVAKVPPNAVPRQKK